MAGRLTKLKKLRGRSLNELCVRAAQALNVYAERRGWSRKAQVPADATFSKMLDPARMAQGGPAASSLLEHFRARTSPAFFRAFAEPEETIAELNHRWPRAKDVVVERADLICQGYFDLLGLRALHFGEPVDWHLEPVSGKRAPLLHWSCMDELDSDLTGDKKITWELNRHQYLMTLGRAYWHTRDERYAQTFVAHLDAWMDRNPPKLGINWASSLEISFRAISWLWALHFFKNSSHLTPQFFLRALKFLYLHARHLETYLSTYSSPNTHLTGEALGLFYLGTLLPEFRLAPRWRSLAKRILISELDRQIHPDGVYFEQSSYYQRYTTDFYIHLLILMRANNEAIDAGIEKKLTALLDHLMYITRPDGTTPFFGDDDGGRLVTLDERAPNDFRATLSTGAALFARTDYKYVAGELAEETIWLLGGEKARAFDRLDARPPAHCSIAFASGGYYVMRDGWGRDANYLLIDCGPHGTLNCGHAHADALAFDLAARGRTLLADPGTCTYTGSKEVRDYFRSTPAHNALTMDGQSSSVTDGPFSWKRVAHASTRVWESRERYDYFEGEHDGYMLLDPSGTYIRSLLFLKNDYWIIRDRVAATGRHRYDLNFHFAAGAIPGIEADAGGAAVRERKEGLPGLEIFSLGLNFEGKNGEWHIEDGWLSERYGERSQAPVCIFSQQLNGCSEFVSLLIPRRGHEPKAHAREIDAEAGRAFEILDGDSLDVLILGRGALAKARHIASDFEWSWARFTQAGKALQELVLRGGGQNFYVDGHQVVLAGGRIGYLVARRIGRDLFVETDASGDFRLASLGAGRVILNGEALTVNTGKMLEFVDGRVGAGETESVETFV